MNDAKIIFQKIGNEIKENILSKWIGSFVSLGACVLTIILAITYGCASTDIYNGAVIAYAVCGALLFLVLSLFRQTSQIGAVLLMVFDFLCLIGFATSEGLIDYFSTQFFDGVSVAKFFSLPAADWLSVVLIIVVLIVSSVGIYLPQNKKTEIERTAVSLESIFTGKDDTAVSAEDESVNAEVETSADKGAE